MEATDLFDRYIKGEMSPAETSHLLALLQKDPRLIEQFMWMALAVKGADQEVKAENLEVGISLQKISKDDLYKIIKGSFRKERPGIAGGTSGESHADTRGSAINHTHACFLCMRDDSFDSEYDDGIAAVAEDRAFYDASDIRATGIACSASKETPEPIPASQPRQTSERSKKARSSGIRSNKNKVKVAPKRLMKSAFEQPDFNGREKLVAGKDNEHFKPPYSNEKSGAAGIMALLLIAIAIVIIAIIAISFL